MLNSYAHHRRIRRISGLAGVCLLFSQLIPFAAAQQTHYTDVSAGAYYEGAASALLEIGALDRSESRLRPSDLATRAELAKLLVNLHGEALLYPDPSNFNDIPRLAWYFPYIEAAANAGWVHGDGDCYKKFRPCTARPSAQVNRAEAATLLVRAFALERTDTAPDFVDVDFNAWYAGAIQTAADHCVLQGDSGSSRVRPSAFMNRAEMVVMFYRAYSNMHYGTDCGTPRSSSSSSRSDAGELINATATSSTRVRLTFNTDIARSYAEDESRYTVTRIGGGGTLGIQTATLLDSRTVELLLSTNLSGDVSYRVNVLSLQTSVGVPFSDSVSFTFPMAAPGHIVNVKALTSTRIQITFDTDLDIARAEQSGRYLITDGSNTLSLRSANLLDDRRTVELSLADTLVNQRSYTVFAQEVQTSAGVYFTDSDMFVFDAGVGATFSVMLTGIQEIPARITTATGSGTFILTSTGLQYNITVRNMSGSITAAHFHEGATGIPGPVLSPITFVGQHATGTWTGITDVQRNALLDRRIYVNVHTAANPDGEIRGQLLPQ